MIMALLFLELIKCLNPQIREAQNISIRIQTHTWIYNSEAQNINNKDRS